MVVPVPTDSLAVAIGQVAPIYNLGFVLIVIYLFIKLFRTYQPGRRVFLTPWAFIFAALIVYVIEEVFTVLRKTEIFGVTRNLNGFFELIIISLFIYALLSQREWVRAEFAPVPSPLKSDFKKVDSKAAEPKKSEPALSEPSATPSKKSKPKSK